LSRFVPRRGCDPRKGHLHEPVRRPRDRVPDHRRPEAAPPRIAAHDPTLAKQLRESSQSIAGNLAEGRRRLGRDRLYHWSVAAGSTDESFAWLRTAVAAGYVEDAEAAPALALLDRELAITWRLTHPR
jgi:four helix bundle protein